MSKKARPVGLWVRVSTDMQVKADSPANQLARLREFVKSQGWKEAALYQLDGVSGAISLEHPEAKRMLRDLEAGTIKALLATRFARVAREGIMLRQLHRRMQTLGAEMISLDENIDTSTPAGQFMFGVIADLAEMERKETSSRVRASVKVRAKAGKKLGGEAPFGYRWEGHELVIHPDEAPVRKLVHELFLELGRKKAVAQELNERGYQTRRGKAWSDSTVEWLLRDPTAKGTHRRNYQQSNGPGKRCTPKDESEVVLHPVPAIVSPDVWDRALARLDQQRSRTKRETKRPKQLFTGLVVCACGHNMYVRSGSDKYTCYRCNTKVLQQTVEEAFLRRLRHHPVDPAELAALLADADDELTNARELLQTRDKREHQLERELKKALTLHEQGRLDETAFTKLTRPLQTELTQLQAEIPHLQARVTALAGKQPNPAKLLGQQPTLADAWSKLDFEGRQLLAKALLIQVRVEKSGRMHVELAHLSHS
jgi:site-specific DNA recombinase